MLKLFEERENRLSKLAPAALQSIEEKRYQIARSSDPKEVSSLRTQIDQIDPDLAAINQRIANELRAGPTSNPRAILEFQARNERWYDPYGDLYRPAQAHGAELNITLNSYFLGRGLVVRSKLPDGGIVTTRFEEVTSIYETRENLVALFDGASRFTRQASRLDSQTLSKYGLTAARAWDPKSGGHLVLKFDSGGSRDEEIPIDFERPLAPQLKTLLEQRLLTIERQYNVQISRESEEVSQDIAKAIVRNIEEKRQSPDQEQRPLTRAANFPELAIMEKSLARSYTSLPEHGKLPLKIILLNEQKGSKTEGHYFSHLPQPTITSEYADYVTLGQKEEVFIHELSHRAQHKLWGSTQAVPDATLAQMGWDGGILGASWSGDNRIKLKDGSGFCSSGTTPKIRWTRCRSISDFLAGDFGLSQLGAEEIAIKSETIRAQALVHPSSDYFDNPIEEHAEALMNLRLGGSQRASLLKDSPALYAIAKADDQKDIDMTYPRVNGEPPYIRVPSGEIVKNDAAAQALVKEFESR